MSLFGSILCAFNRHSPVRRKVHWDGMQYIGNCRRCGTPIKRLSRKSWRALENTADRSEATPT